MESIDEDTIDVNNVTNMSNPPIDEYGYYYYQNIDELQKPQYLREKDRFILTIVIYSIAFIIGIIGNLLVVFAMLGDKKARSVTTLFLVSLAVSDLLFLLICVPYETSRYFLGHWSGGMALCKISGFCEMLSAVASILNLTAVSVERYIVIVHPMRSRSWCTIGSAKKIIVIVWIASCLLSAPVAYVTGLREDKFYNGDQRLIMAECIDSLMNMERYIFAWYQLIVMFAVPTYIMVFCYARVIYVLWISTKELAKMTQRSQQRDSSHQRLVQASSNHRDSSVIKKAAKDHSADIQNARKQVIKMLITIILVFLICWGPKLILRIISRYPFKDHMNSYWRQDFVTLKVAFNFLPYIQSAANPVIYGVMSSNFRKSLFIALNVHCLGRPQVALNSSIRPAYSMERTQHNRPDSNKRDIQLNANIDDTLLQ